MLEIEKMATDLVRFIFVLDRVRVILPQPDYHRISVVLLYVLFVVWSSGSRGPLWHACRLPRELEHVASFGFMVVIPVVIMCWTIVPSNFNMINNNNL